MGGPHNRRVLAVRLDDDTREVMAAVLAEHGVEIWAFISACAVWLADDPDMALATLARHWPAPRKPGRPRNR